MDKRIEDSSKIFDMLYNTKKLRYNSLPNWQKTTAHWLKMEHEKKIRHTYKIFKRGTIIFVDFGLNIGHEFSGKHFAIVLNKEDKRSNSILTVVPLTSKEKDYYLPLEDIVFNNASKVLNNNLDKINNDIEILYGLTYNFFEEISQKGILQELTAEKEEQIQKLISKVKLPLSPQVSEEEKKLYATFNKVDPHNVYNLMYSHIQTSVLAAQEDVTDLKFIIDHYKKFDKQTYACVNNITSISKLRIGKMNRFDPSGKMEIDENSLNLLDNKFKELFTL